MTKFDKSKLEKMNPDSRQYLDQCDRVYGSFHPERKVNQLEEYLAASRLRQQQERRVERQLQWRTHG